MSKISLAQKFRPNDFSDLCEQESVKKILTYQCETKTNANAYLFCGSSGCGKAQPLWSNVLTPNGYKTINDIHIGDEVIDGEGNTSKVIEEYPQENTHDIYKITFNDRTSIFVADNHLNSVVIHSYKKIDKKVLNTLELIKLFNKENSKRRKDLFCVDTPIINFSKKEVELDPYLVGVLIGDGSLNRKCGIGVSLNEDDIKKKVENIISNYNCKLVKKGNSNDYDYNIVNSKPQYKFLYKDLIFYSCVELAKELEKDGYCKVNEKSHYCKFSDIRILKKLINKKGYYQKHYKDIDIKLLEKNDRKNLILEIIKKLNLNCLSINKHIPKEYLFNDFDTRLELLRGLMDTDGYVGKSKGCSYTFSTSSKQLSEDFSFLVRSLGCVDTVSTKIPTINGKKYNISYNHYIKVPNNLCIVSSDKHLKKVCKKQLDKPIRKIINIEKYSNEECKCIMIESNCHEYITDNLTVTHNTTSARILAKMLNGENNNCIEIDAASNNSVDDIRKITQESNFQDLTCEYKIFIIDEAHMLSTQAWNAFLKTLEEPPLKTIFIMCTTDPQKIPKTILSRVQRYDFKKISYDGIIDRLLFILESEIANGENITYDFEAIEYIARLSQGGMRDAITSLDKCLSYSNNLTIKTVESCLDIVDVNQMNNLSICVLNNLKQDVIMITEDIYHKGNDIKLFVKQYLEFVVNHIKYLLTNDETCTIFSSTMIEEINKNIDLGKYTLLMELLIDLSEKIKYESNPKILLQANLLKFMKEEL